MRNLQEQLRKIEKTQKDGNFVDADGNPYAGQDELKALMHRCWRWTEIVLERYVLLFVCVLSIPNLNSERAKSTKGSRSNTIGCLRFATSWIDFLSHKPGRYERRICSVTSGNSTELTRRGLMATLSTLRVNQLIFMPSGYSPLSILNYSLMLTFFSPDIVVPDSTQLCLYLCPPHFI